MKNRIINAIFKVLEPKKPKNPEYWELINIKTRTVNYQLHQLLPDIKSIISARIKYFFKYKSISFLMKMMFGCAIIYLCYISFFKIFKKEIEYRYFTSKSYPYSKDTTMNQRNFMMVMRDMEARPSISRLWDITCMQSNRRFSK